MIGFVFTQLDRPGAKKLKQNLKLVTVGTTLMGADTPAGASRPWLVGLAPL